MQFSRNLKHIFLLSILIFISIISVVRFFGGSLIPLTHFFVYRENVSALNVLYKYHFHPSSDIVIIKIDNDTLNYTQSYSDLRMLALPKKYYSDLIEKLESAGVRGIAFDIIFQNQDPEETDFANVLEKHSNVAIARTYDAGICTTDVKGVETCPGLPRPIYKNVKQGVIDIGSEKSSAGLTDRRIPIYSPGKLILEQELSTLPIALYRTGIDTDILPFSPDLAVLSPYFGGPTTTYNSFSMREILEMSRANLMANLGGKYVFVGESGTIARDEIYSPVTASLMDGVESHAHFLDGVLQGRYMKSWDIKNINYMLSLIALIVLMTVIYLSAPKYMSILIAIGVTIWIVFMSRYLYFHFAVVIEIFPILLAGAVFTFPLTFVYRFFIVDREKRMLTSAFAHYVDKEVVDTIAAHADTISLGGESKELTILFSDIAGFTTISEKLSPPDLFYLMSSYLSVMTDILTSNGGTLDKYIGDAVMGFFGAPLPEVDHAVRACHTALDMREALPHFNNELLSRGLSAIDFRVGIGSGEVLVGNIGSHERFNYTVLGDTVNLASRLEAISKEYGTHIIVSEDTYRLAREQFYFRKLDLITVKGKDTPVGIYELIANISNNTINKSVYERYERGLDMYMHGNYLEAGKFWETQIDIDPPSRIMAHRCLDILKGDITIVDGIYHMTKK